MQTQAESGCLVDSVIIHSRADDVVPLEDSEELIENSGLPTEALIEVGDDHRLANSEPLEKMLKACRREWAGSDAPR